MDTSKMIFLGETDNRADGGAYVALWYDPRSLGIGCRRRVEDMRRDMKALSASIGTTNPRDHHVVISRMGVVCGAVREVRWKGTEAEIAAVERAHAELVQALHATIRAAVDEGGRITRVADAEAARLARDGA